MLISASSRLYTLSMSEKYRIKMQPKYTPVIKSSFKNNLELHGFVLWKFKMLSYLP